MNVHGIFFQGMTREIPRLSMISVQKTAKLAHVFCTLAQVLMERMEAEDRGRAEVIGLA